MPGAGTRKVSQNPQHVATWQETGQRNVLKSCRLRIRFVRSGVQPATILASFGGLRQFPSRAPYISNDALTRCTLAQIQYRICAVDH